MTPVRIPEPEGRPIPYHLRYEQGVSHFMLPNGSCMSVAGTELSNVVAPRVLEVWLRR